ncbi:hypothetical protein FRC00_009759 [Tulasnella sp. 408]|nr:hypothetical protein FRC00_009759 [Tulasnella sp. 408]
MNDLSNAFRSKPSWWTDLKDPALRAQWTEEALQQNIRNGKLSAKEVEQVLSQLENYATMRADSTGILPSCYAGLYQSDKLISEDLKEKLVEGVKALENAPDTQEDWRASSGGVLLDLVDPALFPAVYGRTLCWTTGQDGKRSLERLTAPSQDNNLEERSYSTNFSWIPTEFQLGSGGEPAKALGYINNVHPKHGRDLVTAIEALVGRFSLLWDRSLIDLQNRNRQQLQGQRQTPEKPEYAGGPWTVQGMANERIVASAAYYSDSDNVTEHELEFRVPVSLGSSIRERNDAEGIKITWGLEETSPLKLIDPTKPGYRYSIVLHLVDPENHIPSTTDIPPQQAHWPQTADEGDLRVTMTLEEAKKYREQLFEEQRALFGALNEQHFETKLSL